MPDPLTAVRSATAYLQHAIERDPRFAPAYTAVADVEWWKGFLGLAAPKEAFSHGTWAALRAVEIDPGQAYAHALLGVFRGYLEYDWREVRRKMDLALQLDSECPDTRFHYGVDYLLPTGQITAAIRVFEGLIASDPLSPYPRFWLALAHYLARDYQPAAEHCRLLRELAPDRHPELQRPLDLGHFGRGLLHQAEGRFDEAVTDFRRAVELSDGLPSRLASLGSALARNGDVAGARAQLDRFQAAAKTSYVPATAFAWLCLGLGDIDTAFSWMDRAIDEHDPLVTGIADYPTLAPLQGDPRFERPLRRMKLDTTARA